MHDGKESRLGCVTEATSGSYPVEEINTFDGTLDESESLSTREGQVYLQVLIASII